MNPISVKIFFTSIILLCITISGYSQKEFFRSQQVFTKEQMSSFYSSITIHEQMVIFNANDYYLYAYNKKDGSLTWFVETNYKSTLPVFVKDNIIYGGISKNEIHQAAQFDLANGNLLLQKQADAAGKYAGSVIPLLENTFSNSG